jgi:hypothetical protein
MQIGNGNRFIRFSMAALAAIVFAAAAPAQDVEGQPLAKNVNRVLDAFDLLGMPLPAPLAADLRAAIKTQDAAKIQKLLDPQVLVEVNLNPEARVKAKRGPAEAVLQQGGYTPLLIKVVNESTVTAPLKVVSPQALPIYSQGEPNRITDNDIKDRFLDVSMYTSQPMTDKLSGLKVEYAIALLHSNQAGKREAVLHFNVGQGTQDLGFRGEVPVLFTIRKAIPVTIKILDEDGTPTTGRFTFTDKLGRIYPPQAKRLAPDFFFQKQVYRSDGETVDLPPGELTVDFGRGPEYRMLKDKIVVSEKGGNVLSVKLQRWVRPSDYGLYSGDHHIHAAGCAHYTNPTEGVFAKDMFRHVKGEGMNVGCNLTWGPCYDFQRQFFEPTVHKISEPFTLLKYDVEVSGFGSQALGHVCLLNLRDQTYPGSEGTKTKGWPTWTTPLMRWAKMQGAYTGYAHSASGLDIKPPLAATRNIRELDADNNGQVDVNEAKKGLLPAAFAAVDTNDDGFISLAEMQASMAKAVPALPNYVIPEMGGIGAQEICVTTAQGLCDFISAMDTDRVPEWNCWYHIMNCGFPLKASGETDFPCITGSRVGQGRVYVQLGKINRIDFPAWADGLATGKSYVSDGYAHALQFTVDAKPAGDKVNLAKPGKVAVRARVAFAADVALGTANGAKTPTDKQRRVEVVVNGYPVAETMVPADDKEHDITFDVPIERSSWVTLRHFPQMHTNPVNVIVNNEPIRASRRSALWCLGTIEQLWQVRAKAIAPSERNEAEQTFDRAKDTYRKIAAQAPEGS